MELGQIQNDKMLRDKIRQYKASHTANKRKKLKMLKIETIKEPEGIYNKKKNV